MKLTHVRLLVDDVPAAVAFYRDVLGFEVRADFGQYVEFVSGDVSLSVFDRNVQTETAELRPAGDGSLVVLQVESADETAKQLGERVLSGPVDRPDWGLRVLYVRDPAGNLVELYEDIPHVE